MEALVDARTDLLMPLVITKMIVHLWRVPMVRQLAAIDMRECGVTEKLLVLQEVNPPEFKSERRCLPIKR